MRRQSLRTRLCAFASMTAILANALAPAALADSASEQRTTTPIKHVIIIVGENRTFDHLFATYKPRGEQTIDNLLTRGIVKQDGSPGPYFAQAIQRHAWVTSSFEISPASQPYAKLPAPNTGGTPRTASDTNPPPFATLAAARKYDYGLESKDAVLLTIGASGLPAHSIDTRIANVNNLPSDPSSCHRAPATTTMPPAPFIASTRCGSRATAEWRMRPTPIPAVASTTSSPGSR